VLPINEYGSKIQGKEVKEKPGRIRTLILINPKKSDQGWSKTKIKED